MNSYFLWIHALLVSHGCKQLKNPKPPADGSTPNALRSNPRQNQRQRGALSALKIMLLMWTASCYPGLSALKDYMMSIFKANWRSTQTRHFSSTQYFAWNSIGKHSHVLTLSDELERKQNNNNIKKLLLGQSAGVDFEIFWERQKEDWDRWIRRPNHNSRGEGLMKWERKALSH